MNIVIEVTDKQENIQYTDKNTGEIRSFVKQEVLLFKPGEKYPDKTSIAPPRDQQPYAPGRYTLSPDSIYVGGRFNTLMLNPVLVPVPANK